MKTVELGHSMGHFGLGSMGWGQACVIGTFLQVYLETQAVVKSMEPDKSLRLQ